MQELRKFKYFENLGHKEFELLSSFTKKKHYKKDSILFYEKDMPTSLFLLVEGVLKVYKTDMKNNEIILHRFEPVTLVAEMAALEEIPYPASASFESDGVVLEIDYAKFKKEFFHNPDVALAFFKSLSKKIKYLEDVIALNVVLDSTSRLAKFLYDNQDYIKETKHYQLAKQLHMTPETLSRTFKKLTKLNLIKKTSNTYTITNKEGLQALFEN